MKIYTKTGDGGETGMMGGGRVSKSGLRMQAIGEVDELNAGLGVCRSLIAGKGLDLRAERVGRGARLEKILRVLQEELFHLGADLATPLNSKVNVPRVETQQVEQMEKWIDEIDAELAPLQNFILPGGTVMAAQLHLARTVCRRAERVVVALSAVPGTQEKISENILKYLNRLSDLLFVMARLANALGGGNEELWRVR